MTRWYGKVGFIHTELTAPGVYEEVATERNYYGSILKNNRRWQAGMNLNDDILISNQISIICDSYIQENSQYIRYVEFMGALWKIQSLEIEYPRLVLTLGGLYNGDQ